MDNHSYRSRNCYGCSDRLVDNNMDIKPHIARDEIEHSVLDSPANEGKESGRYTKIGTIHEYQLIDKIVYPANICPKCGSLATYHRRIQESGDIVGNIFAHKETADDNGRTLTKFDLCLDCHEQFIFEIYIWKRIKK